MKSAQEKIYTFSVGVTGRCDSSCSYCHYYATRDRKSVSYDISTKQFIAYMKFIRHWCATVPGKTFYRFSGGEPTVLGDRLFELANIGFQHTGARPFILTAGKRLEKSWVEKAKRSQISHIFVSVENPIDPQRGAPNPFGVVQMIRECNSPELPIVPGVCIVPNNCFKYLYRICEWFYKELGRIPLICEVNYSPYQSPNEDEWRDLERELPKVIKDFFPLTQLNLFSSVVPELAYGGKDPYVFDLNLENTHCIDLVNYQTKVDEFIGYLETVSYPRLHCNQTKCPWNMFCQNTKWYWQIQAKKFSLPKLRDYCRFKRVISDAFYRTLIDPSHISTTCEVKTK